MTPEQVLKWILANRELAITLVTLLVGGGGAARQYRKTGRIPLATLPWRALRRLVNLIRRRSFARPRPRKRAFHIDEDVDAVRERLGVESFEPGWPLSYHYHGEDLNARRYIYNPNRELPHRQVHVRGFVLEDGTVELIAHEEPAPIQHPKAHLRDQGKTDATGWLREQWPSPALDPRTFDHATS